MNDGKQPQAEVIAGTASETRPGESRPDVEIEASASAEELRALERPRTELSVKARATSAKTTPAGERICRAGSSPARRTETSGCTGGSPAGS